MDVKEEETFGHLLDRHWYYRCKGLALRAMLRGRPFHTLLDIGAGSGIFSKQLLRGRAASAICIDPAYQGSGRNCSTVSRFAFCARSARKGAT